MYHGGATHRTCLVPRSATFWEPLGYTRRWCPACWYIWSIHGAESFTSNLRNLHFSNNKETRLVYDKCWKLRRVITIIQDRFRKGWSLAPVISFDEGVLPNHSKMNTTRMFMKDKPHKWGTKMFLACDAVTAYCHRFEV